MNMADTFKGLSIDNSNSSLYKILKNCVNLQSSESLPADDYNDVCNSNIYDNYDYCKMISANSYSTSGNISCSSFASDESFTDNILEEDGRISLAYENLRTIPRRIAEKFAAHTKCLDLSYNNFQNLSFLSFFGELHTLILDHNTQLDVNTLPYLSNLRILWINNCDISNVSDWVHRIQVKCPALEHLSIMGNPGIKQPFNYFTLESHSRANPLTPMSVLTDYRVYIFSLLPNLNYLDGAVRNVLHTPEPSTSSRSNGNASSSLNGNSMASASEQKLHSSNSSHHKTSPTLSFKELFRLKCRKKSFCSSSTN